MLLLVLGFLASEPPLAEVAVEEEMAAEESAALRLRLIVAKIVSLEVVGTRQEKGDRRGNVLSR